jgi:hypothetical protein
MRPAFLERAFHFLFSIYYPRDDIANHNESAQSAIIFTTSPTGAGNMVDLLMPAHHERIDAW